MKEAKKDRIPDKKAALNTDMQWLDTDAS